MIPPCVPFCERFQAIKMSVQNTCDLGTACSYLGYIIGFFSYSRRATPFMSPVFSVFFISVLSTRVHPSVQLATALLHISPTVGKSASQSIIACTLETETACALACTLQRVALCSGQNPSHCILGSTVRISLAALRPETVMGESACTLAVPIHRGHAPCTVESTLHRKGG